MSSTLLIYEEVPEKTKLFVIPNSEITEQQRAWLKECQNRFINSDDENDGMLFINTAISNEKPEEGFEAFRAIWKDKEVSVEAPLTDANITNVYVTGFVM